MPGQTIFEMPFSKVYPMLVQKAEKKGRTENEVFQVTSWLTGYKEEQIKAFLDTDMIYGEFFSRSPDYNPASDLITGKICGILVESIEDPLMKRIRQLDKLVDELAKGRPMEKVLRK